MISIVGSYGPRTIVLQNIPGITFGTRSLQEIINALPFSPELPAGSGLYLAGVDVADVDQDGHLDVNNPSF